ncbi:hypothetical protein N658DRAFT_559813 [Parathielavia hyrcaniae]|uniref:SAC3/GANP/THP3 conserved domain-containing protein n=1 Tax=Parathielavia hyrcaniae TaxID=113614 RepID=A0AAN6Q363_9PEZI|nr:hypothetical protein N658DRAFT_559813 [Parathielavia hyrcaniae]
MAAPANNPFGVPPAQVTQNPFGASASGQPASAFQSSFGAPTPKPNPFGAPVTNPFSTPAKSSFSSPGLGSTLPVTGNTLGFPFGHTSVSGSRTGSPAPSRSQSPSVASNPFAKPAPEPQVNKPFGAPPTGPRSGRSPSPFGSRAPPKGPSGQSAAPGSADANAMARRNKFAGGNAAGPNASGGFGGRGGQSQGPQRTNPFAGTKPFAKQPNGSATETSTKFQRGGRGKQPERQARYQPPPGSQGQLKLTSGEPTERTKQLSPFAFNYANKLYSHLKKENISPPQWPAEPGNPDKRGAVESLKESFKKYRTRVYSTLRKADLIDDPEKRRKLEDALPFKGICEDMCPEFEKVYRIAEYDVKTEEKESSPNGLNMWPDPARMVKKFGRSAAGQDAPLPMDVRSVDALRRTTDYLFNDLLQLENNLPSMHNFLWDRTRAVRKDFTFHSQKSPEEMKDMVYCFETLTRFHATALHLLSKKGFALESFDQKQEIEQLGRTILSLIEAYDECRDKRVQCENEPEFRAYYLLLNAHDPSIAKRIPAWGKEYWFESEEVQTALSLIQAMDDVRELKGPIKPRRPTTLSDTSFTNYFSIVEDPRVSYMMACIAEIHFTTVRQGILRSLVRCYARHRDAPRTITASDLNAMLRFDTPEEAVEFAELHGFEFSTWVPEGKPAVTEPYLLLNNKKRNIPSPRVRQSFSGKVVERKRTTQSLPHVIYNTIFEELAEKPSTAAVESAEDNSDGLFVSQADASKDLSFGSPMFGSPGKPPAPGHGDTSYGWATFCWSNWDDGGTSVFGFSGPAAGLHCVRSIPSGWSAYTTGACWKESVLFFEFATVNHSAGDQACLSLGTVNPKRPNNSISYQTRRCFEAVGFPTILSTAPTLVSNTDPATTTSSTSAQDAAAQTKARKSDATTSNLGSTPLAGANPFSTAPPAWPPTSQATTAASAAPSIFVSPPPAIAPSSQGAPSAFTNALSNLVGTPISGPSSTMGGPAAMQPTPPPPPPPKRDLMGDVTRWYVKGDSGLMEDFTESILAEILWGVWQRFEREEAERRRREEDEESWRLARTHQEHRLQVKYFYRWRNKARTLATKRILREGKERMRLYREQQKALQKQQREEKEQAEREARIAAKRQLIEDAHHLSMLASTATNTNHHRHGSVAYSADHSNPEEQLLASGIFTGLRNDPRALARRVVRDAAAMAANGGDAESWAVSSGASRSYRYPDSELELELEPAAESPDISSVGGGGGRREGWKTRSLREKFGIEPRRSLSASGSVVNGGSFLSSSLSSRFRQSLPGSGGKATNFSRQKNKKRSAEDESDGEPGGANKRLSLHSGSVSSAKVNGAGKPRSRHWDFRARGFVPLPDGNWVPEALARRSTAAVTAGTAPVEKGMNLLGRVHKETTTTMQYDLDFGYFGSTSPDNDRYGRQQQQQQQQHDVLPDDDDDEEDASEASLGRRAPSPTPTPSDLHLRLARFKKPVSRYGRHGTARSVDFGVGLLGDASPPHPPFTGQASSLTMGGMLPPAARGRAGSVGMGKRKRGGDEVEDGLVMGAEVEGFGDGDRDMSPLLARKRANVDGGGAGGVPGDVYGPGREETSAMVANTRRMLRELREAMDMADRDVVDGREERLEG